LHSIWMRWRRPLVPERLAHREGNNKAVLRTADRGRLRWKSNAAVRPEHAVGPKHHRALANSCISQVYATCDVRIGIKTTDSEERCEPSETHTSLTGCENIIMQLGTRRQGRRAERVKRRTGIGEGTPSGGEQGAQRPRSDRKLAPMKSICMNKSTIAIPETCG
jgi:hypothetical protein